MRLLFLLLLPFPLLTACGVQEADESGHHHNWLEASRGNLPWEDASARLLRRLRRDVCHSVALSFDDVHACPSQGDREVRIWWDVRLWPRGESYLVRCDRPSGPQRPAAVSHQTGLPEDEDQTHRDAAAGVSEAVWEGLGQTLLSWLNIDSFFPSFFTTFFHLQTLFSPLSVSILFPLSLPFLWETQKCLLLLKLFFTNMFCKCTCRTLSSRHSIELEIAPTTF